MIDTLPQEIDVPDRDAIRDAFLADFRWAEGGDADTSEGTLPWIDASAFADSALALWAQIKRAGSNIVLSAAQGKALETWATNSGLEGRKPATGATGFVIADVAAGGATILAGDELKGADGVRYACSVTSLYKPGDLVPVAALDSGAGTNREAGVVLDWTAPRPGCGPKAVVWEDSNGNGLTGGRPGESDAELLDRILFAKANPPASGNAAHWLRTVADTPGVPVQAAFCYPAIKGPGTVGVTFTVQPSTPGGSRAPTAAQLAAVEAQCLASLGVSGALFVSSLVSSPVVVALRVAWRDVAWSDVAPWPAYAAPPTGIVIKTAASALAFSVGVSSGSYAGVTAPVAGQTIGLYNPATRTFARKRIASVTGAGPWSITCDATSGASDASFVPIVGQRVSPWCDAIDLVVPPVLAYFDTLGPGEQVSTFFDAGTRQKRVPESPRTWPSSIAARLVNGVQDLAAVQDATLAEPSTPLAVAVGVPGVFSRIHQLSDLCAFPL